MTFVHIAEERLLESPKQNLGDLVWDVEPDASLQEPVPSHIQELLKLMPRRGLEPVLVSRLFDLYPYRAIERGLLAWDVARGSLLGRNDQTLSNRLSFELAALKRIGASPGGVAVPRDRIGALLEACHPPSSDGGLDDYLALPSLAGLAVLGTSDDQQALVNATLEHATRLASAHLPSLATAFLQILWDRFAVRPALDLMLEIALDYRLLDAVPQVEPRDEWSTRQKAYGLLRAYLLLGDMTEATTLADSLTRIPATATFDVPLFVAKTELALHQDQLDAGTYELLATIAPPESNWRYAVTVRDAVALRTKPEAGPVVVANYISRFGNSVSVWNQAAHYEPTRASLLQCLSRELRYVSHDPEVWRALALFSSNGDAIYAEVQQRLDNQLRV